MDWVLLTTEKKDCLLLFLVMMLMMIDNNIDHSLDNYGETHIMTTEHDGIITILKVLTTAQKVVRHFFMLVMLLFENIMTIGSR